MLRFVDGSTLGKANVQLELLLTTVLFLSREGFRLALTRNLSPESWNVAWLTIPLVTLIASAALVVHILIANNQEDSDYKVAGILYCIGSWIEGCAEPAVLHFLRNMDTPKRSSAEALGTLVKAVTTVAGLSYFGSQSVTAFGLSQLMYAITYTSYLYWNAMPSLQKPSKSFDLPTCYKIFTFSLQGILKHLLTEADRIVLTTISNSYNQGIYAMGSSYGGMAARILLQPLEENARLLLSRLAIQKAIPDLERAFVVLVKLVLYIAFLFAFVAVNFTNLLLNILAGQKWGSNEEAASVLSAFCVYTAFLASNGMTEAFVYGVTSAGIEIGVSHTATGVIFAILAPSVVAQYGTVGLVALNCLAMLIRSACSMYFAAKFLGEKQSKPTILVLKRLLKQSIPHPIVIGSFISAFALTRWSLGRLQDQDLHASLQFRNKKWLLLTGQHLAAGAACVVLIISLAISLEKYWIRSLRSMIRPKYD
jgi:oligosaccharide translocation protein RFT1